MNSIQNMACKSQFISVSVCFLTYKQTYTNHILYRSQLQKFTDFIPYLVHTKMFQKCIICLRHSLQVYSIVLHSITQKTYLLTYSMDQSPSWEA